MSSNNLTRHHRLAKALWGSNYYKNIVSLRWKPHNAFHQIFAELPFPYQVIKLINLTWEALQPHIWNDIKDYLWNHDLCEMFNPNTFSINKMQEWEYKNKERIYNLIK